MSPKSIKNKILAVLRANAALIALPVRKVFDGVCDNKSMDDYPNLCLELIDNNEGTGIRNVNGSVDNTVGLAIGCYIRDMNAETQLDALLDLENAVKKALSQDITLAGEALKFKFERTLYTNQFWPVRVAVIPIMVDYRQNFTTRA